MKIVFKTSRPIIVRGSYRIWIYDLCHYMNELGIDASINTDIKKDTDVVILDKSDIESIDDCKKKYPFAKIGIINPSSSAITNADFSIAGSVEEVDSLSFNKHVFLYPLIERMFEDKPLKKHKKKDGLRIGFHGHYPHLSKFHPHLTPALKEFSKECKIDLFIISSGENFKWKVGRPKIDNIEIVKWDVNTIEENLYSCDMGIIPNMTDIKTRDARTSVDEGLYTSDYMVRFKNKSNAGRAFVFMQLGIPVIADLTPSNLHILGDPNCGYAVFSKEGWLKALRVLRSPEKRTFIAKNANDRFKTMYNPMYWTESLCDNIRGILK